MVSIYFTGLDVCQLYMLLLIQCAKLLLGTLPDLHALRTHKFSDFQSTFANVVIRQVASEGL